MPQHRANISRKNVACYLPKLTPLLKYKSFVENMLYVFSPKSETQFIYYCLNNCPCVSEDGDMPIYGERLAGIKIISNQLLHKYFNLKVGASSFNALFRSVIRPCIDH